MRYLNLLMIFVIILYQCVSLTHCIELHPTYLSSQILLLQDSSSISFSEKILISANKSEHDRDLCFLQWIIKARPASWFELSANEIKKIKKGIIPRTITKSKLQKWREKVMINSRYDPTGTCS